MESKERGPAEEIVRAQIRTSEPPDHARIVVELLTDPWSVWCWGFEPVRRTLQLRYPSIDFRFLLGGMFPRMPTPEESGFDIDQFFGVVQRTTGMPVRTDGIRRDPATSTFPACIFVHAARLLDPEKELAYLRALREAAYLDGLNISRPEVGARVAARVGLDPERWRATFHSGQPEAVFNNRMERLRKRGLVAYPTLLVKAGNRTTRIEGFQSLPAVLSIVAAVAQRRPAPRPDPTLEDIIPPGERVATREVAEVLGVSVEKAYDRLQRAARRGLLSRQRQAAADVWRRRTEPRPVIEPMR